MAADLDTLYDRAGGTPFFEALVGRFYAGVATDPVLRPIYPEPDLAARPTSADALPDPVLGRPDDVRRRSAATRACGCATRRSRSGRRSAIAGWSTCAPRSPSLAPPADVAAELERYFAMAAEAMRNRELTAARPAGPSPGYTVAGTGQWRTDRPRRPRRRTAATERGGEPASRAGGRTTPPQRGKTIHGEAANAGHRVLAPDDAEVEAYLETALKAPSPDRSPDDRPAAARPPTTASTVVVLDFGSQFAQLIARRVRELDVYSELLPHDTPYEELERRGARAIILSGGPNSVYDTGAPRPDPAIWSGRHPRPRHLLRRAADGPRARRRRHRRPTTASTARPTSASPPDEPLFAGIEREQPVWMSHGDSISRLPEGFHATAQTDSTPYAGLVDAERNLYGIQFHPEVVHTPRGKDVLRNFVVDIAGIAPTWTAGQLHRHDRRRHPRARRRATPARPGRTGWSSARCRAASTRRSRRRSSIARSAIG